MKSLSTGEGLVKALRSKNILLMVLGSTRYVHSTYYILIFNEGVDTIWVPI